VENRREQLVRREFEAMRELTWLEQLEPKCREEGMDTEQIKIVREPWDQFSEARDWGWWLEESARDSEEKIQASIKEIVERIENLTQYRQTLTEASHYPTNDSDIEIDP
jgi:hypothetical protein